MQPTRNLRHGFRIKAETAKLRELREKLCTLCTGEGVPSQTTRFLILAIDEAVSNIIEHARLKEGDKKIQLSIEIGDKKVIARISDRGKPFDPSASKKDPDARSFPRRGFGLYLIHKIVDGIKYERTRDGRNVLILTKQIG